MVKRLGSFDHEVIFIIKTNKLLVEYAKAQLGKPYWYGTFGRTATAELYAQKKQQYPDYYKSWSDFPQQYGKRVHDCVGLIKGFLWSDSPTGYPVYNPAQDVSANGMRSVCREKGDIGTMPDIPGVLVFMDGHVGVYIGNGEVIEARGHEYGVVKTALGSRPWKWWGKCPYIEYEEDHTLRISLRVRPGTWFVRTGAGADHRAICVVKGSTVLASSKELNGWYFIDSLDGWISAKGVTVI